MNMSFITSRPVLSNEDKVSCLRTHLRLPSKGFNGDCKFGPRSYLLDLLFYIIFVNYYLFFSKKKIHLGHH